MMNIGDLGQDKMRLKESMAGKMVDSIQDLVAGIPKIPNPNSEQLIDNPGKT